MYLQDAAEKLDEDATQCGVEDLLGPMVEAAKKIANKWKKIAQLIRYV